MAGAGHGHARAVLLFDHDRSPQPPFNNCLHQYLIRSDQRGVANTTIANMADVSALREHLSRSLLAGLAASQDMGGVLLHACEALSRTPAHTLGAMRQRSKKVRGDVFEVFCQQYLLRCHGLATVWLLHEVPPAVRDRLHLTHRDVGIDLIGRDAEGEYYAVQAKFRRRVAGKRTSVTWKELSTFYALCARAGPFKQHIVMTTADYVRRMGKKKTSDVTIGFRKLQQIPHFEWLAMATALASLSGSAVGAPRAPRSPSQQAIPLTRESLRQKRLRFFAQNGNLDTKNNIVEDV